MKTQNTYVRALLLLLAVFVVTSCSTVPKETVELSYVMGQDIQALYSSYDKLIHDYYEKLRDERRQYLDKEWYPRFLKNWRDDGELIRIAKGERIWSEEAGDLIDTPSGTDPAESLKTLNDWVQYALYAYEVKEEELFKDLDQDEQRLREDVDKAFQNLIRANATITAHLNSLREVQAVQDEILEAFNIKELRDQINEQLISASEQAAEKLETIKKIDASVDDLTEQIKSLTNID